MSALDRFNCRQCANPHELTTIEIEGRKLSPWTRSCSCGARYQLTKTENRLIAWGPGYTALPKLPRLPVLSPVLPPLPKL